MNKKFSDVIVELRHEKGLTQQELANKLNITDKAVSKWERGLSYPDITSISNLADILGTTSAYLIDLCKKEASINPYRQKEDLKQLTSLILKAIGIAMGVGVVVLNILNELNIKDALTMLGLGLTCISISLLNQEKDITLAKSLKSLKK